MAKIKDELIERIPLPGAVIELRTVEVVLTIHENATKGEHESAVSTAGYYVSLANRPVELRVVDERFSSESRG